MKKVVLTGDRPTGPLHLGHFVGSLRSRVELQQSCEQFVMIADTQALSDHFDRSSHVVKHIKEVCKDYLAVGIDPKKTTIFIQSKIPALAELSLYYMNLVSVSRLERNPTVKAEIQQKEMGSSIPAGFLCYPVSQAADITAFKATLVPVGDDQLPMIEQTNEIVRKFNRLYQTQCLTETSALTGSTPRLVGIDGKAKASKSLNNAIFLNDDPDEVKKKVMSMYTDPNHIHVNDPGKIEGNVVFAYLDAFHHDTEQLIELKNHYQRGGLGDVHIKKILLESLIQLLEPIQKKRALISDDEIQSLLQIGCEKANNVASATLLEVKKAMGIDYGWM
jgi:tryptophanyl-tRNA synthetase